MEAAFNGLILGVFATVMIDVWGIFSIRVLGFPRTRWAMVEYLGVELIYLRISCLTKRSRIVRNPW